MRTIFLAAALILIAGCAPDGEEALALCREEADQVIEVAAAEYPQRKSRHIEHCMRAFGYVWDRSRSDCADYERFRDGEALTEGAGVAGRCFRSAFDDRARLSDRISNWFN